MIPLKSKVADGNGPNSIAVDDFNADGRPDIATANDDATSSLGALLGKGDGILLAPIQRTSGGLDPTAIAEGDLTGGGRSDLVGARAGLSSVPEGLNGNIGILINDGVWPPVWRSGGGLAVVAIQNLTLPSHTSRGEQLVQFLGLESDPADGPIPGVPTPGRRGHTSNAQS